jgi:protocatechuate 3,4-dioxygenase beta subunit
VRRRLAWNAPRLAARTPTTTMQDLHQLFESNRPARRDLLKGGGALALGGVAASMLGRPAGAAAAAAPVSALPLSTRLHAMLPAVLQSQCNFTPTQVTGPFYLDLDLVRQDITEGKPGIPVYVILQLLRASDCQPLANVAVDLWQTDGLGKYSGFAQEGTLGQTFCRGTQFSDSGGLVIFKTIYPGWYPTRTCHIHFKVHPTATTEFTSQLYYPQFVTDHIYATYPPYTQKGPANLKNNQDPIFSPSLVQAWIPNPDGSLGLWSGLIIGVNGA